MKTHGQYYKQVRDIRIELIDDIKTLLKEKYNNKFEFNCEKHPEIPKVKGGIIKSIVLTPFGDITFDILYEPVYGYEYVQTEQEYELCIETLIWTYKLLRIYNPNKK